MKLFQLTLATLVALTITSSAFAQNSEDWRAFGQELINQLNNGQNQPKSAPMQGPNSSGQYNSGQFNNPGYNYGSGSPNASGSNNNGQFNNHNHFNNNQGNNGYYQNGQYYNGNYYRPSTNNYQNHNHQGGGYYYNGQYYPNSSSQSTYRPTPSYTQPPVAPKVYSNLPIVIHCPAWCQGSCDYQLITASGKAYDYTISGGKKQHLTENSDWKIRYDQGNGLGYKTYDLRGGNSYELRGDGNGSWAFYLSE